MTKQATIRKRCTECRRWFRPVARLVKQQRVCGEVCRRERGRRLSRARRAREPARYREEERERKRRSRQAAVERAAATQAGPSSSGHAPGETPKMLESREEFARMWDEVVELSRAGWEQELRRMARQIWRKMRHGPALEMRGHAARGFSIP